MPTPGVTVILVSYNTCDLLREALRSLPDVEVIVVDNASHDGSAEMVRREFPHVHLIANSDNLGFGAANNQGLRVSTRTHALLLNSDARAHAGAIQTLYEAVQGRTVAAGGRLQYPDGRLQESACGPLTLWAVFCEQTYLEKLFPPGPYWRSSRLPEGGPVAQVMGACLMMSRRLDGAFDEFDERFFLYAEDTELCHRLALRGEIRYVPSAVFDHVLGASSQSTRWQSVALYNFGKEAYFLIHHGPIASRVCWLLNRMGALLRILASGFVTPKARLFWRVLFARADQLPRGPAFRR